jgi:hypothetical protein
MFFGRLFAYLAIPGTPVYVGELVLGIGIVEGLVASSAVLAVIRASAAMKVLLAFMVLCTVRMLPALASSPLDALRDSALWYYALFAFLAAAAATTNEELMPRLVVMYRRVIPYFLLWAPVSVALSQMQALRSVELPIVNEGFEGIKPGDTAVHAAMVIAFLWLQLDRVAADPAERRNETRRGTLLAIGFASLLVAATQGRSGFLGAVLALAVAFWVLSNAERRLIVLSTVVGMGLVAAVAIGLDLKVSLGGSESSRNISVQQVAANAISIVQPGKSDASDSGALGSNVTWRQDYWSGILADARSPEFLLTGQGFGFALAYKYGLADPDDPDAVLRSAHNSHLTVLARVGYPGLALWLSFFAVWTLTMLGFMARRRSRSWASPVRVVAWLTGGALGFVLHSFFDPAMDGPMVGIWVWSLVGLAVAHAASARLPGAGLAVRLPLTAQPLEPDDPRTVTAGGGGSRHGG